MTCFDYLLLSVSEEFLTQSNGADAQEMLNEFGSRGWDLATAVTRSAGQGYILILRKAEAGD